MAQGGQGRSYNVSYDLALEVTYHHFAPSFWLLRSALSHGEGTTQGPEYRVARIIGVHLGGWLPPSALCPLRNHVLPFAECT